MSIKYVTALMVAGMVLGLQGGVAGQGGSVQAPTQMPMAAPFFAENEFVHSLLTLVVNNSDPTDVDVVFSDFSGNTLTKFTQRVPAHGRVELALSDKLSSLLPVEGSITVVPRQRTTLGAQLSMTIDGVDDTPSDLEEEFVMPDATLENPFYAVGMGLVGEPVTAIRSLSAGTQHVTLSCLGEDSGVKSAVVLLGPGSTRYVRGCLGEAVLRPSDALTPRVSRFGYQRILGISVSSDGMPGDLAVYGFAPTARGYESLPFSQASPGGRAESVFPGVPVGPIPGFHSGFQPEVGVANFGSELKSVQVFYSSGSEPARRLIAAAAIAPRSSLSVPLPRLPSAEALTGSFEVSTDNSKGDVISRIRSVSTEDNGIFVEIPAQYRDKESNGGQHPWRVDDSVTSSLLIFNAERGPRPVDIEIYTDKANWEWHLSLKPFETKVVRIAELVRTRTKDYRGRQLPTSAADGIVTWSSLATNKVFWRLMITDSKQLVSRNFSCNTVTMICGAEIDNPAQPGNPAVTSAGINLGEVESFKGYANTCPGTAGICECNGSGACTGTTGTANTYTWSSSNSSVAPIVNNSQSAQTVDIEGVSAGTTTLQISANGPYCSGSGQATLQAATCPSTILYTSQASPSLSVNNPPYKTGMGTIAVMSASAGHSGSQIAESLSLQSSTCGANYQIDCGGGPPFTVGTANGGSFQGVLLPKASDAFYDEHEALNTIDVLGTLGLSSCNFTCVQTYSCQGAAIGRFTITYQLSHGNGVTNVTATKSASD